MAASDANELLAALSRVVEGLDHCWNSGRSLSRPNIGTLHFMPMPDGKSLWGLVKRYPNQREPFYAVFEVEGNDEPNIVQEAHYTATRRLEAHYLASAAPILAAFAQVESARRSSVGHGHEDFRTLSLRIPPNPFAGEPWKLRYRHRQLPKQVFELEYVGADLREAFVYSEAKIDLGARFD